MEHYLGAQVFTVRNLHGNIKAFDKVLEQIAQIGYNAVHGYLMYPDLTYPKYKDMLDKHGLRDCTVDSKPIQDIVNGDIQDILSNARLMGVKAVSAPPIPLEMKYTAEGFAYYANLMNEAGRRLYEADGLYLSYHNHAQEFASFGGTHGMDIFFDNTDERYVHFILDTHWVVAGGCDPAKWIRKAGPRADIIHFKDYRIVPGANQNYIEGVVKDFAEIGKGNIDWTDVVAACKSAGTKFYIVEQDTCPANPLDSLKTSFVKLKELNL